MKRKIIQITNKMQNKPKFKVGDEAFFVLKCSVFPNRIEIVKAQILEVRQLKKFRRCELVEILSSDSEKTSKKESELLTKEEALIKLQEFLNAK